MKVQGKVVRIKNLSLKNNKSNSYRKSGGKLTKIRHKQPAFRSVVVVVLNQRSCSISSLLAICLHLIQHSWLYELGVDRAYNADERKISNHKSIYRNTEFVVFFVVLIKTFSFYKVHLFRFRLTAETFTVLQSWKDAKQGYSIKDPTNKRHITDLVEGFRRQQVLENFHFVYEEFSFNGSVWK